MRTTRNRVVSPSLSTIGTCHPRPARRHHPHRGRQPDQRPPRRHRPAVGPPPARERHREHRRRDAHPRAATQGNDQLDLAGHGDDRQRRHPRPHPGSYSPGPHRLPAPPPRHALLRRQHQPGRQSAGRRAPDRPPQPPQHGAGPHRHHQRPGHPTPPRAADPTPTKARRTWHTAQKKTLRASGRYSFGLRPPTTGTNWWRVYKASDTDHIGDNW
jgi:hypothetical protein